MLKKNFKITNMLVLGNISSGKSFFINRINSHFNFKVLAIDDLRVKFGDGSFSKEYYCWLKVFESIERRSGIMIEITGAGPHKHAINQAIKQTNKNWLIIYLQCALSEIHNRLKSKNLDTPYPWKIAPEKIVDKIHIELEMDMQNRFWENENTSILTFTTTNKELPDMNDFLKLLQ